MANVLGTLFEDIATAIREKTNDSGTMKPAEFPDKIRNIDSTVDTYNLGLAEMMMNRDTSYFSYDNSSTTKLSLRGFKCSDGNTLATLSPYSFAGFAKVKGMRFTDIFNIAENAFVGNTSLKVIDITSPEVFNGTYLQSGSLNGCTALEAVIVRGGKLSIQSGTTLGANSSFYVYVDSQYYDTTVSNISSVISSSRICKLEDYPEIDNWYDTY